MFQETFRFDAQLLGSRLLVLHSSGEGLLGMVSGVSAADLTLDAGDAIASDDIRRLWILRPSDALLSLTAVGRRVRVLLADGSRAVGRVLESRGFGTFLLLTSPGVLEVSWLDVQGLEPAL